MYTFRFVYPALQSQVVDPVVVELEFVGHVLHIEKPDAEYVPARQSVHATVPVVVLYFPASQAVHRPPFGPVKPALQAQAASAELSIGEVEPAGHARQVAAVVAAIAEEYVATAQSEHKAGPVAVL